MENAIHRIEHWIRDLPEAFGQMSGEEIENRPLPHKWSKKEILGHLCDSAINNMSRFIKMQYDEPPYRIESYNQDRWVSLQHYQDRPLDEIMNLFCALNKQIINIIITIPKEKLANPCVLADQRHETLEWLIHDYVEHMEHHINSQLLIRNYN